MRATRSATSRTCLAVLMCVALVVAAEVRGWAQDSNPGVRRGQHPPSAALLVSPAIVAPSRHTDVKTRRTSPVVLHVSR